MKVAAVAVVLCTIVPPTVAVAPVLPPVAPVVVPPARGGHAQVIPARGGQAVAVLEPVGDVPMWTCIHRREAAWNDPADPYWGGLQMDRGFMLAYGADMVRRYHGWANVWPIREQLVVAQRGLEARGGYNPWPNTGRACGAPMYLNGV